MSNIRRWRVKRGIQAKECVTAIKAYYPGYNKSIQSYAEQPDKYGICLSSGANAVLREAYGDAPTKRENRQLTNRLYLRLADDEYAAAQQMMERRGFTTMQDYLRCLVREDIAAGQTQVQRRMIV